MADKTKLPQPTGRPARSYEAFKLTPSPVKILRERMEDNPSRICLALAFTTDQK